MNNGIFYIGDPYHVIKEWDAFLKLGDFDQEETTFTWKDYSVWMADTAYGDGEYASDKGHTFLVDSGMIGVIPIEVCNKNLSRLNKLGLVWEFDQPFNVGVKNGIFYIGNIVIDTVGLNEEFYFHCNQDED